MWDTLPLELLSLVLNGWGSISYLDGDDRFHAKHVSRRWYACIACVSQERRREGHASNPYRVRWRMNHAAVSQHTRHASDMLWARSHICTLTGIMDRVRDVGVSSCLAQKALTGEPWTGDQWSALVRPWTLYMGPIAAARLAAATFVVLGDPQAVFEHFVRMVERLTSMPGCQQQNWFEPMACNAIPCATSPLPRPPPEAAVSCRMTRESEDDWDAWVRTRDYSGAQRASQYVRECTTTNLLRIVCCADRYQLADVLFDRFCSPLRKLCVGACLADAALRDHVRTTLVLFHRAAHEFGEQRSVLSRIYDGTMVNAMRSRGSATGVMLWHSIYIHPNGDDQRAAVGDVRGQTLVAAGSPLVAPSAGTTPRLKWDSTILMDLRRMHKGSKWLNHAASAGNLRFLQKVARWLPHSRTMNTHLLKRALRQGHTDVASWLHANGTTGCVEERTHTAWVADLLTNVIMHYALPTASPANGWSATERAVAWAADTFGTEQPDVVEFVQQLVANRSMIFWHTADIGRLCRVLVRIVEYMADAREWGPIDLLPLLEGFVSMAMINARWDAVARYIGLVDRMASRAPSSSSSSERVRQTTRANGDLWSVMAARDIDGPTLLALFRLACLCDRAFVRMPHAQKAIRVLPDPTFDAALLDDTLPWKRWCLPVRVSKPVHMSACTGNRTHTITVSEQATAILIDALVDGGLLAPLHSP